MKKLILLGIMVLCFFAQVPRALADGPEDKNFGLGIYLGEPTGVTGKFYFAEKMSFQGIASWSFYDEAFTLIGDVLFDIHDLSDNNDYKLPIYVGVGGKFAARDNNSGFGIHAPIGIAWQSMKAPIEIAFEIAPGLDLAPDTDFDIHGGIAFRFYF